MFVIFQIYLAKRYLAKRYLAKRYLAKRYLAKRYLAKMRISNNQVLLAIPNVGVVCQRNFYHSYYSDKFKTLQSL